MDKVVITKTFLVCAGNKCDNVLGCFEEGSAHRFCETTKPGDDCRTFGCDKKQYFYCTFEKDMIRQGDAIGETLMLTGTSCRHCPDKDERDFTLSPEEMGPVAYLSSMDDDTETLDSLFDALENMGERV